jgi:hypothetical protein
LIRRKVCATCCGADRYAQEEDLRQRHGELESEEAQILVRHSHQSTLGIPVYGEMVEILDPSVISLSECTPLYWSPRSGGGFGVVGNDAAQELSEHASRLMSVRGSSKSPPLLHHSFT